MTPTYALIRLFYYFLSYLMELNFIFFKTAFSLWPFQSPQVLCWGPRLVEVPTSVIFRSILSVSSFLLIRIMTLLAKKQTKKPCVVF